MVSTVIGNSMTLIYLYIKQKIHPYDIKYIKPIIAGGVSYLTIYFLNHIIMWDGMTDVVIKGFIYVIVFSGSIILMRLDEDDKIILKTMFNTIMRLFKRN